MSTCTRGYFHIAHQRADSTQSHSRSLPSSAEPRLPSEIITHIVLMAGSAAALETGEGKRSREITRALLGLASVNRLCYEAIFANLILPQVTLTGVQQVHAFRASLAKGGLIRRLARQHLRRLCCIQSPLETASATHQASRSSLYDALIREQSFDKATTAALRTSILPVAENLRSFHLESPPSALKPSSAESVKGVSFTSRTLEEVSCTLTTWGGTAIEDMLVGAATTNGATIEHSLGGSPWANLSRVQILGRAGFRFSLATASSLGSLPQLQHLTLVMPNFARDAGMTSAGGEQASRSAGAPAALQLLILLTAGRLQTFAIVGHNMEGWLGWSPSYRSWMRSLRLPALSTDSSSGSQSLEHFEPGLQSEKSSSSDLLVRLITARSQVAAEEDSRNSCTATHRRLHPNHFSSWMTLRTVEGLHWDLPQSDAADTWTSRGKADASFGVEWQCEEWTMPRTEDVQDD